jgi:hypothetical protein
MSGVDPMRGKLWHPEVILEPVLQVRVAEEEIQLTLSDPEEREWARMLGDKQFLFERRNDTEWECYYKDDAGEIYKFVWVTPDTSWCLLDHEEKALEVLKDQTEWAVKRGNYDEHPASHHRIDHQHRISSHFSKRQLKKQIVNHDGRFFTSYFGEIRIYSLHYAQEPELKRFDVAYQHLLEIFDELRDEGKQTLLNDLFLKSHYSISWHAKTGSIEGSKGYDRCFSSALLPFVTLDSKEIAKQVFKHAIVMNLPFLAEECLQGYPELIGDNELLFQAISMGHFDLARLLVDRGVSFVSSESNCFDSLVECVVSQKEPLTQQQEGDVFALADFLFDHKAPFNSAVDTTKTAYENLSYLDAAYFGDNQTAREIGFRLMEKGAPIPRRVASDLKIQVSETKNTRYAALLREQGLITAEEEQILLSNSSTDVTALTKKGLEMNLYLESRFKQGFLNPDLVPIEKLQEIRALKKELKKLDEPQAKSQYERLKSNYERLTLHHKLLKELKALRSELKGDSKNPSTKMKRFSALFSDAVIGPIEKIYWRAMVHKIFKKAAVVEKDPFLKDRRILWVHGTKSTALPLLFRMRALEPLGMLLEKGVAPLCGEINSDIGSNKTKISGEMFTASWDEEITELLEAKTRLLISYLYACKDDGYEDMGFDPKAAWDRLGEEEMRGLIKSQPSRDLITYWAKSRVDILRLRMTDPEADVKFLPIKKLVEESLQDPSNPNWDSLQRLFVALTISMSQPYTSEELQVLKNPYPIVFASTTAIADPTSNGQEYQLKGRAELGKDIQMAFTQPDKVEELQRLLEPFGVKVYDFETAFYLEMMQMTEGSSKTEEIGQFLQTFIFPEYASLFPSNPSFRDEQNNDVSLEFPLYGRGIHSYEEYARGVEEGVIFPRDFHGPVHAGRVALWCLVLAEQMQVEQKDRFLLTVAGAAHDWARQDEGPDFWDKASAEKLKNRLLSLRYPLSQIEPFIHAIREKDPKGGQFTSLYQKIVHDADALEIIRCLVNEEDFKKEKLTLPLANELIQEILLFIKLTEEKGMKQKLERSEHLLQDLVEIIRTRDEFNLLKELAPKI